MARIGVGVDRTARVAVACVAACVYARIDGSCVLTCVDTRIDGHCGIGRAAGLDAFAFLAGVAGEARCGGAAGKLARQPSALTALDDGQRSDDEAQGKRAGLHVPRLPQGLMQ